MIHKRNKANHSQSFSNALNSIPSQISQQIKTSAETGAWLHTIPTTYNGTELSAQELRDRQPLCYCCEPLNLHSHCDGCGAKFSITHALSCKVGGLVHMQHNKVKEELAQLCAKAFSPSAVRDEPKITPTQVNTDDDTPNNNNSIDDTNK